MSMYLFDLIQNSVIHRLLQTIHRLKPYSITYVSQIIEFKHLL